ncbi:hypothetical protein ABBQ38_000288 [Trebouxia sp. C0009 RCD-2024]
MLQRAWQVSCVSKAIVSYTVRLPRVLSLCLSQGETAASLHSGFRFVGGRTPMQTFRQRRTSDRLATRSHTTQNTKETSDSLSTLQPIPAQPAAKKRKTTAVKPTRKRLKGHSTSQHEAAAPAAHANEATSSADTLFDATPALTSIPSGIPASIPAHVPADPNVLHCWTKASMAQAAAYLADRDPALAPLIKQHGVPDKLLAKGFTNMFNSLARSILSQQLAVKAASVIQGRFMALCQCEHVVTPEAVLSLHEDQMRGVGLSYAKARYILDLAKHFQSGQLSDEKIATMDDDTLVEELTKVKGIGRWTVDMFAMFHLGRPDVFPLGDLAVRKGLQELYQLKVDYVLHVMSCHVSLRVSAQ